MKSPSCQRDPGSEMTGWTADALSGDVHRDAEKATRVRSMFNAIAPAYDLNNRLHSFGRDQAWRRAAVKHAQLRAGDAVLDVACGTGDLTAMFAAATPPPSTVVGVDFTEGMLEIARRKSETADPSPQPSPNGRGSIEYEQGDAMDLRFDDASFDVVSIAFGLRNVSEPPKALAEFRRVLRPGGRLVVLEFDEPGNPLLRWGNRVYCRHIMPLTATLIAGDRSGAYRYLPKSVATFLDREQMQTELTAAGFEQIEQYAQTFGVCVVHVGRVPG